MVEMLTTAGISLSTRSAKLGGAGPAAAVAAKAGARTNNMPATAARRAGLFAKNDTGTYSSG